MERWKGGEVERCDFMDVFSGTVHAHVAGRSRNATVLREKRFTAYLHTS
jgi:hypothetical protein